MYHQKESVSDCVNWLQQDVATELLYNRLYIIVMSLVDSYSSWKTCIREWNISIDDCQVDHEGFMYWDVPHCIFWHVWSIRYDWTRWAYIGVCFCSHCWHINAHFMAALYQLEDFGNVTRDGYWRFWQSCFHEKPEIVKPRFGYVKGNCFDGPCLMSFIDCILPWYYD